MAKKVKPAQIQDPEAPQPQAPVKAPVATAHKKPEEEVEGQLKSVDVIKVDRLAPVEDFDPRKNLRTVCNGVWKYICGGDVDKFDEKHFSGVLAKDFGIRENDLVYLVGNKKYRIVVV